ncbi:MAG: polymerase subunit sigma-24 [Verrucomicrobiales bacterium]|nr:polymerase subunit sigma-24 [Verrucomicrobiales bacterium]
MPVGNFPVLRHLCPEGCSGFDAAVTVHYLKMNVAGPSRQSRVLNCNLEGADLIHRAAQGDADAFAALYDLYSTPLYSLAFYILKDGGEAGIILKEVFLSIRRHAAAFDRLPVGAYAWLALKIRCKCVELLLEMSGRQSRPGGEGGLSTSCSCAPLWLAVTTDAPAPPMPQPQNSPNPDDQPDSHALRLAVLLERNYAVMHRMQVSHGVLEAEVGDSKEPAFRGHRGSGHGGKGAGHI